MNKKTMSRRRFVTTGGAVLAGGAIAATGCATSSANTKQDPQGQPEQGQAKPAGADAVPDKKAIQVYRKLGRTNFQVSDIGMGCGMISESNVVRYAYDHGVNFFDTAEGYGNGDSEAKIGQAMPHLERKKIFIVTKLKVNEDETAQSLIDRFGKCLERMKTDYVDALYSHAVDKLSMVKNEAFHSAVARLKADGKLKHAGISSHGPRGADGDSMEQVLGAAVEDGRYDLMLLVYNFMNHEQGRKVIEACKAKNVGVTAMKVNPGVLKIEPFDPDKPNEEYAGYIKRMLARGMSREQAVARIREHLKEAEEAKIKTGPFMEKHGLKSELELHQAAIRWVLANADIHTSCISLRDFDLAGRYIPLSGSKLSSRDQHLLRDWALAYGAGHCRHGCTDCIARCPHRLPVSTIMRYSYYFHLHGREKLAMQKYAGLGARNAGLCLDCDAPCIGACPHGVGVQANLVTAHDLLSLA